MDKEIEESFLDDLVEVDPTCKSEILSIEKKHGCNIIVSIEKHNALQYTYYYEIDFGLKESLFIEIESGINNGTLINHQEWGYGSKPDSRTVLVLKDIVLDMSFYEEGSFIHKKASAVLSANKNKLFDFHRQDSYDNYVTGGHSKMKMDSLLSQLHLEYIYEHREVDCNFI